MNGDFNLRVSREPLIKNLRAIVRLIRNRQYDDAAAACWSVNALWRESSRRGFFPWLVYARGRLQSLARRLADDDFINRTVPPLFRVHDAALFPNPATLAQVEAFTIPSPFDDTGADLAAYRGGFLFYGETGTGKTRAAFRMLNRWTRDDGFRFRYLSAPVLKRQMADAARAGKAHEVIEQILADDERGNEFAIFIDDFSQARFTPSFAESLFEMIDRIHRERRVLIVTVQTTGAALVRKWCADDRELADTAEAIARRLRDYCTKVRFSRAARETEQ